jgi:hypothetical protein
MQGTVVVLLMHALLCMPATAAERASLAKLRRSAQWAQSFATREDGLTHPANTPRSNLAACLGSAFEACDGGGFPNPNLDVVVA